MAYQTLDQVNVTEPSQIFTYVVSVVPIFPSLLLVAIFLITTIGSYFAQKRIQGIANFPASYAVGGFVTASIALVMSLLPGFLSLPILIIAVANSIGGFLWFVFSDQD